MICIAGRDKPHRCVKCWAASELPRWRRPFPRRCRNGHWTLTTYPRRWQGKVFFLRAESERLRGEVARLQSEWDRLNNMRIDEMNRAHLAETELSRVRAEVTAAKADAFEYAAHALPEHFPRTWLMDQADATRAELGDS